MRRATLRIGPASIQYGLLLDHVGFDAALTLMPADTGKRLEYETAKAAGDKLSAHFHDYDWADEVLHAHIGRKMLKKLKVYRGTTHPHEAQKPERLEVA